MDSALSPSAAVASPNPKLEWFLLHAGFGAIGIITTSLGPLLPMFSHRWGLSDAQAGFFFTVQYLMSLAGGVAIGWLLPRYGFSKVLGIGFLFLTLGMAFLGISPWFLTAFCVLLYGFGYGLANPATNLRGTQLPSSNVASAVSLLNFSWGIGAVSCPFLVAALVPWIGIRGLGASVAVITLAIAVAHFLRAAPAVTAASQRPKHSLADWKEKLGVSQAVPLALLFFLYVGTETGVGGWVAALEKRMPSDGHISALAVAPSVFYGFLLFGRGLAWLVLRRHSTVKIALGGLVILTVGTAIIAAVNSKSIFLLGVGMAGFGCAAQYPVLVTWLAAIFRKDADWLGALFFSAGGLGGSALPWLIGIIATQTSSLRVGFLVPLVASASMVLLAMRARPAKT
jgi:fucose permease